MRITSKGQVTIPPEIRKRFGLVPDTEVEFVAKKNSVEIVKSRSTACPTHGEALVHRLRGRATVKMSTDDILALTRR